jgi:predicted dehydrogenase
MAAWKKTSASVRSVFDISRELAEKRAREFDVSTVHQDLDRLIEESDIVDVCTPPHTHAEIARKVIDAGRHLLIEKPLVTSTDDWDGMVEAMSGSPSKIAVVHNLKFVSSVQRAKRWVEEGRIGRVIGLSRQFLTDPSTDRMIAGGKHWSHDLPGGRWFETLPHELYLTHYFAGPMDLSSVTVVRTATAPRGVSADEVLIAMKGPTSLGTIHYSANCALNKRMLFVYGTEGMITVDLLSDVAYLARIRDSHSRRAIGRLFMESGQTMARMIPDRMGYTWRQLRGRTPHEGIIQAFVRYLDGKGPSPSPVDEIDYVVRNCDRIGRAIDSQAEDFALAETASV